METELPAAKAQPYIVDAGASIAPFLHVIVGLVSTGVLQASMLPSTVKVDVLVMPSTVKVGVLVALDQLDVILTGTNMFRISSSYSEMSEIIASLPITAEHTGLQFPSFPSHT